MSRRAPRLLSPIFAAAIVAVLASVAVLGGAATPAQAAIQDPFSQVFTTNANGDIAIIGNTLQTCSTTAGTNIGDCISDRAATASTTNGLNNNHTMQFVDIDGDATTFNSSSATLTVPTDGTVLFAALVWSGRTAATAATNADPALRGNVKLTVTNGAGTTSTNVTGTVAGNTSTTSRFYQGYQDVTALVAAGGSGTYTIANVQSQTNATDRYAGWALVVALGDPNAPKRNLTIFKGLADLSTTGTTTQDFTVSGFLTPPQGAVTTKVGVVAYEGDRGFVGDSMSINGFGISNSANPADDVFNSTITTNGVDLGGRTPNYSNQLGFDADVFTAPAGAIANSATSAAIRLTTASETYYPGVVTFATDLYDPKLNGLKSVTRKVDADSSGSTTLGDTLSYSVVVQNDGLDTASDSVFFDAIPTGTTYVPGSLTVDGASRSDAADGDTADYSAGGANGHVTARLGAGASATAGGDITTISTNPTDTHTVTFDVLIDSAVPGQGIVNAANISYAGKTTATRAASVSNAVSSVLPNPAPVNQPPVAPNRTVAMTPTPANPGTTLDLLALATDPENDTLTLVDVTDAAGGTVTVNPDGTVTYVPAPGFAGRDVFTYTVQDSFGNRSTGVVRIDVLNTPPVAVDDTRNVSHRAATTLDLVANDTDANGDTLVVRSITANGVTVTGSGTITTSKNGTLTLTNGAVTYTPPAGGLATGQTEAFSYVVQDVRGGIDDADVVLTTANASPVAANDTARSDTGAAITISPLVNDTDADGDPLTITAATTTGPNAGTVTIVGGQLQYTPKPGFVGTDVITYTISDGSGGTSTATVTVTVNGPPVANPNTISTPGDTAVTIDIVADDTDPNGDTLTLTSVGTPPAGTGTVAVVPSGAVTFTPATGYVGTVALSYTVSDGQLTDDSTVSFTVANIAPTVPTSPPAAGTGTDVPITLDVQQNVVDPNVAAGFQTLTTTAASATNGATTAIESDGTVTVTPATGYTGPITVTYTVSDGVATVTSTVTVNVADGAPTAAPDPATTPTDTSVLVDVLANDSDPNGAGTLSIQSVATPTDTGGVTRGTAVIESGQVRYTPPTGFAGTVTFDYTITDGTTPATSTVTVTVGNAIPVANPDTATTPSGAAIIVDVLGNDTDANIPGTSQVLTVTSAVADNGATVTIGSDGRLTVTPPAGFAGDITVTYGISDGAAGTSTSTLVVTVQNAPPAPIADTGTTTAGSPMTMNLLGNDTDANSDVLSVSSVTQPVDSSGTVRGTVTMSGLGIATVTPAAGFVGTLTFSYVVDDGNGGTATGTASVTVSASPAASTGTGSGAGTGSGVTAGAANGLAITGSSPAPWAILAMLLLVAGAALRLRASRARHAAR